MSLKAEVYTKLENSQFEQNIISGVSSRRGIVIASRPNLLMSSLAFAYIIKSYEYKY
jgi:hypothetical protein